MNAAFFKALRQRNSAVFGTSLSQGQVDGIEAILAECRSRGAGLHQTAYILATGYGETGGKMQAVRENLNYSAAQIARHFGAHRRQGLTPQQLARNPKLLGNTVYGGDWGAKYLGNTQPGDGFNFRGFWIGQFTGRCNAEKAGRDLGLDLVGNPELLNKNGLGCKLLVRWMLDGRATGIRLGVFVNEKHQDYLGARKVWGGVNASKYVGYAKAFEAALIAGGYEAGPQRPAPPMPAPVVASDPVIDTAPPAKPKGNVWAALASLPEAIAAIIKALGK